MADFLELAVGLIVLILLLFFVFRDITVGKKKYEPSVEPIGQRLEIAGKAFVIDGDTIKVSGERVRIAGIDAPELGQLARYPYRNWYDQGESVKIKLIKKIGGKYIRVERKNMTIITVLLERYIFSAKTSENGWSGTDMQSLPMAISMSLSKAKLVVQGAVCGGMLRYSIQSIGVTKEICLLKACPG